MAKKIRTLSLSYILMVLNKKSVVYIVTSPFSKSSVFKMFSVLTKIRLDYQPLFREMSPRSRHAEPTQRSNGGRVRSSPQNFRLTKS